jgi:hypothetical protein
MRTVEELRAALAEHPEVVVADTAAIIVRARRRRTRRRVLLAGCVSAIVAVAVAAGLLPFGETGAQPAAAAALNRAAERAAAERGPATGDATVWFVETQDRTVGLTVPEAAKEGKTVDRAFLVQQRLTARIWQALPNRQRYDQLVEPAIVAQVDRAAWIAAGRPSFVGPASFTNDPGTKGSWELLLDNDLGGTDATLRQELDLMRQLPTDPADLADWLRDQVHDDAPGHSIVQWCPPDAGSCGDDAKVFQAAAALLATPVAPARLRAALYRMLGRLDGVRFAGPGTDDMGRPATTVTIATGHLRYELLFDPDRAALLETRQVLVTPEARTDVDPQWTGAGPGAVVRETLYLRAGVVSEIGAIG